MSKVTVFVGLDYHKSFVQVCVLDGGGTVLANGKCPNTAERIASFVRGAAPRDAGVFAAVEACTGAANLAEELIAHAGWSIDLAHAGYVAKLKQSPDKTDFSDARLLADLERVGYLPKVWLPPESLRDLRRLVRYRQQLANQRRNVKLRISAVLREERIETLGRKWTKGWLQWLKEFAGLSPHSRWVIDRHLEHLQHLSTQIVETEKRIEAATASDAAVQKLMSMKGVGLVTAATLRAEIGRFDRFRTGKQLSRFCGVSPRNVSSGQKQADGGLIKAGNTELRRVLIETAHRLSQFDARWAALKTKLRLAGKAGSVAAAAVANRWVRWLYYEMKPQRTQTATGCEMVGGLSACRLVP
jgi:transposase